MTYANKFLGYILSTDLCEYFCRTSEVEVEPLQSIVVEKVGASADLKTSF